MFTRKTFIGICIILCVIFAIYFAQKLTLLNDLIIIKNKLNNIKFKVDLGAFGNDKVVKKNIELRNSLEKDVRIQPISSSCGCARLIVDNATIPTQSKTSIIIEFDPIRRKPAPTKQILSVKLYDEDNNEINEITFLVYAEVEKVLDYKSVITFPENIEDVHEETVQIEYNKDQPFIVNDIQLPRGYHVNLKKGDPIEDQSEIYITRRANRKYNLGNLRIVSEDDQIIEIRLVEDRDTYFKLDPKIVHLVLTQNTDFEIRKPIQLVPIQSGIAIENIHIDCEHKNIQFVDQKIRENPNPGEDYVFHTYMQINPEGFEETYIGHFTIKSDGYTQDVPFYITVYDWEN